MPAPSIRRLHATPFTLGGGIFAGFLILAVTVLWIAYHTATPHPLLQLIVSVLFVGFFAYIIDGLSEELRLEGTVLEFRSLFRRPKRFDLCRSRELAIVHEGLNQERGIVSVVLSNGEGEMRIPLGPFWHQHKLEAFFAEATERSGVCRFLAPAR